MVTWPMRDPLLTIEDATREFRVSAKTIRRRLTFGQIGGADKRLGHRRPEWVIPRESLAAAGSAGLVGVDRRIALPGVPDDAGGAAPTDPDEPDAAQPSAGPPGGVPQPTESTRGGTRAGSDAAVADAGAPTATQTQDTDLLHTGQTLTQPALVP